MVIVLPLEPIASTRIFEIHTFYQKLRSGPSTESFLASGDWEYSKLLNSFLTISLK